MQLQLIYFKSPSSHFNSFNVSDKFPFSSTFQLFCSVQINSEDANVSWMKNSQVIAYGATLYLDNLSEQDSGEVICRAENSFGTAEQSAYIYVRSGNVYSSVLNERIVLMNV